MLRCKHSNQELTDVPRLTAQKVSNWYFMFNSPRDMLRCKHSNQELTDVGYTTCGTFPYEAFMTSEVPAILSTNMGRVGYVAHPRLDGFVRV